MSIHLSVVSHGQGELASKLLQDLARTKGLSAIRLTLNTDEPVAAWPQLPGLSTHLNPHPLGFASNHNQAFSACEQPFFCVANPDIRLNADPFTALLKCMEDPAVGLVAPLVFSPKGALEDNARYFPTPLGLVKKALGQSDGRYHLDPETMGAPQAVEWVAGMFLLFRTEAFRDVGGFDDKFHLYYEDVDICARMWRAGWKVLISPEASVVHAAQRASRHDAQYMAWHAASMARYFYKHLGRLPKLAPAAG
jgi:N-acetylglucosaminyl-diphospho-decaprenol L-rhamnosyltransferase